MPNKLTPQELAERHRVAVEKDRARSIAPLLPEEIAGAEALGSYMREMRAAAGLSRARAALASGISLDGWRRIEVATRRTRHSTLERIAAGLGEALHADPEEIYAEMVKRADNALAPESNYRERVERRREKRLRVNAARDARSRAQAENWRDVKAAIAAYEKRLWS